MNAKHTPGPWAVEGRLVGGCDRVRVADCLVPERDTYVNAANARLIASAPDLLAALRGMVDAVNVPELDPLAVFVSIERARAAIAKSEGAK
jgi:hypothetical protein